MNKIELTELIDSYITRLQEVKGLLLAGDGVDPLALLGKSKRRPLSPEGRQKIADAQRARWVKVKKAMGS